MATTTETSRWARARRWLRPPRELSMTAAGKFLCLLTLGVGFGAINTGNNLLFLLLGMMLSLILASGALSEGVLRRLSARRRLPARLVAGTSAPGVFVVENPRRYSSLSVEVADRSAVAVAGPALGRTFGRVTVPWWKFWRRAPTQPPLGSAYTMRIPALGVTELDARWDFPIRGRYRIEEISLVTRFPFGLFEKTRRLGDAAEVVVFPAGLDAADWSFQVWSAFGEVPSTRRGEGNDYFGLRDYRFGEDMRAIHWKTTARRGDLVVRENEALDQSEVEIFLCNFGTLTAADFERAVSKTVGLLGALAARGWRVGLRTVDEVIAPASGQSHLDRLLHELAVVRMSAREPVMIEPGAPRIAIGAADALASVTADVRLRADGEGASGG